MSDASTVQKMIKDNEVQYVDLRFTDPRGKMQHVTLDIDLIDDDFFAEGTMFDGSSIAGWKAINESDMVLMPDTSTARLDPFYAQQTLTLFCNILEPNSGEAYNRDPRSTALRAEEYLKSTGIGDTVYFGPEAEFFVFDDVRFSTDPYNTGLRWTAPSCRTIQARNMKPVIWATVRAPKAATSRSIRSIAAKTCARKCFP